MGTSYRTRLGTSPEEGIKAPCVAATTANISLTGEQTIDGVAVVADDRVLVKDQTASTDNGIYVAAAGTWSRSTDWNHNEDMVSGMLANVTGGTLNDKLWEISFSGDHSLGTTIYTIESYGLGEENTASNIGTDGVGVYDQKIGVDLQFRNIAPGSSKVIVTENGDDIDVDVDPSNISHTGLADKGSNTHAQIDTHVTAAGSHIADSGKHREINDSGSAATDLWSADKITAQVATRAPTVHTHASEGYILLEDQKPSGTVGGGFTAGAWRTRELQEQIDEGEHCSIASDIITLDAGTYRFQGSAPSYKGGLHQCRLRNIDDSLYYIGTSERSDTSVTTQTRSFVSGEFTIADSTTFKLEHQCSTTRATDGLGYPCSFGVEVYSRLEFWKIQVDS